MDKSKDGIILIWSCQPYRVWRYGTGMKVTYFDHDK